MIGVSRFGCLGLMRGEAHDATYGAIVKRQIAEVAFRDGNKEEIRMATLDTRNYPYRAGREVSHRGTANDPASLARKYRRVRPYGSVTALGQAKMRAGAVRTERRQLAD